MPVTLSCPHCKTKLSVPDSAVGKTVQCPKCQARTVVPAVIPTAVLVTAPPSAVLSPTNLIACSACNRMIALTANACPGCGAANTWVHPEIKRFIDSCNSFTNTPPFQYSHQAFGLQGMAEVKRGVHASLDYGIKAGAAGFLCCVAGIFTPAVLSLLLWMIGPLLLLGGMVIIAVVMFQTDRSTDYVLRFSIDFSQSPPTWTSDDDAYWQEVRAFFFQPTR